MVLCCEIPHQTIIFVQNAMNFAIISDGSLDDPIPVYGEHYEKLGQGTLLIPEVQLEDAGMYVCTVSAQTIDVHLKVVGQYTCQVWLFFSHLLQHSTFSHHTLLVSSKSSDSVHAYIKKGNFFTRNSI